MSGKLYIVPTPIGNLEDMTFRAIRILKEVVSLILVEDTRVSAPLLKHFGIHQKMFLHHQYNERQSSSNVIRLLQKGVLVALISDAGTPTISDPGFYLLRESIRHGIRVECLPGATALVPALVNSGLPTHRFAFEGFLPVKKGRNKHYQSLREEDRTMIFYESSHRLSKTLKEMIACFGTNRNASVSREISKLYEETIRGSLQEIQTYFETKQALKGEFVLCVAGKDRSA